MTEKNYEDKSLTPKELQSFSAPIESLSETDKNTLEMTKLKRDLALTNVKLALAQSENAELLYNNYVLQLAMRYKLNEGDVIAENGIIQRKLG